MFTFLFFMLALLLVWLPIDFYLGRKAQLKRVEQRILPLRQSDFRLYTYGKTLYDDLFQDIRNAKEHIHILFFIVNNDPVSNEFLDMLKEKARQDVEVRLLLDRIGSHHLSRESIKQLREAGVHFSFCHKIRFPFWFYSLNQRNHRKITVIDGKIGYIGGFNIGEEYLGHDPKLGNWRDYHLRLTGEGVADLQEQFLHDWYDDTKELLLPESKYFPPLEKGIVPHRFIPTDGAYLKQTFLDLVEGAKNELYIGTPYFVPGKHLMNALLGALKRGVKVTVLVPLKSDHPLVKEAEFPYFRKLLRAGCTIYQFEDGFFHAKIVKADEKICDIGTANFDLRSLYINHEMNCLLYESPFMEVITKEIDQDLENSSKLTLEYFNHLTFKQKCKEWLATTISFFL